MTPPKTIGNNIPKRVVFIDVEPGEVQEGSLVIDPFWKEIRLGNGVWSDSEEKPFLYRTINAKRANENLKSLDMQDPANFGNPIFFKEADILGLSKMKWTPSRGDYAQMVFIIARNKEEFRNAIKIAAKNKRFKNKQVGLIMCGDLFTETAEVRETLLRSGTLMVWHPDWQISPEAAEFLKEEIRSYLNTIKPQEMPQTIDDLIYKALENWKKKEPNSFELKSLELSSTYVINLQELQEISDRALG